MKVKCLLKVKCLQVFELFGCLSFWEEMVYVACPEPQGKGIFLR